jgi:hypothetical protein
MMVFKLLSLSPLFSVLTLTQIGQGARMIVVQHWLHAGVLRSQSDIPEFSEAGHYILVKY